jgi:hypothetical protein
LESQAQKLRSIAKKLMSIEGCTSKSTLYADPNTLIPANRIIWAVGQPCLAFPFTRVKLLWSQIEAGICRRLSLDVNSWMCESGPMQLTRSVPRPIQSSRCIGGKQSQHLNSKHHAHN